MNELVITASTIVSVANIVVSVVAIGISCMAVSRVNAAVQLMDADNDTLRARRDALKAERDAREAVPAGKRLLTELDRVQSMQFGVPMKREPRGRGPHLIEWDAPEELELRQPSRSSRSRT